MFAYYDNLDPEVIKKKNEDRINRVHIIYNSDIPEYYRIVITRWRLSNHELKIETGRREVSFVPRELHVCATCGVLEDEEHVIYNCSLYDEIRLQFQGFLQSYLEVTRVLNPVNTN